jgi:predicted ribosomally synthesized peptide with SipW-like signal peptide
MTKTNKKQNSKDRRIAIASIIVAGMIVAGSTFAWFTSKDEVTNRLTAHADYGVSIVEDFTPPEDWTPGQEINKDVSAVNTGNVDAFVRLGLLYDAKLKVNGEGVAIPTDASAVDKTSWVELKTKAVAAAAQGDGNAVDGTANEVTLLQAGGTLVVKAGAVVTPTDTQDVRSGDDVTDPAQVDYSGANQFKPDGTGLYLFQRTIYEDPNTATVKYSGYYYDATEQKYYALVTEPGTVYTANVASDAFTVDATGKVTMTNNALENVELATTKVVTIKNNDADPAFDIKWMKDATTDAAADKSDAKIIRLTYAGDNAGATLDDVIIDIKLADDWANNWAYKAATSSKVDATNDTGYFFYKKTLAPGATTEKLVDSVTLNKDVTQEAYKDLTFDLSVVLDSIQITPDEAKTADSYVAGVNGAGWGATASYTKDTEAVSWT